MKKIPYDLIAIQADRLVIKAITSPDRKTSHYWWQQYISFLETCGCSTIEFDQEMLRRVDHIWHLLYQDTFSIWN